MIDRPEVIVFDVNETLSDMQPLGAAFVAEAAPAHLAGLWFAGVLRDGFALGATGCSAPFAEIARDSLLRLLVAHEVSAPRQATERIMSAFTSLGVHPDVVPGVRALAGIAELITLSNGAAPVAQALLEGAGIRDRFTRLLGVEDAPAWKPVRSAYDHAAEACGCAPERMLLVAVHPWDIHGAQRAGLSTAWINRSAAAYPGHFDRPDLEARDLTALAGQLARPGA